MPDTGRGSQRKLPEHRAWFRYEVRVTLRAPLGFVYEWATNFTSEDSRYSVENYERRVLRRSPGAVVLEDLYDTGRQWIWLRRVVRLHPPDHWHAHSLGSDREISVDYRLSRLSETRTQLRIVARRRPDGIGTKNPAKLTWERAVAKNWASFGRALKREYELSQRRS